MTDDSDAVRILRERERRRALERARIDDERRDRQLELNRLLGLDSAELGQPTAEDTPPEPRPTIEVPRTVEETAGPRAPTPEPKLPVGTPSPPRAIGGALHPQTVADFLTTDPVEQFDMQALNCFRFQALVEAARQDIGTLSEVARHAKRLMARVKHEVDDPLSAGAFLRDQVLRWYRESPNDPNWSSIMPERWAGLFAESRVSGGRLEPWLNLRLGWLHDEATRASWLGRRLIKGLARDREVKEALERTPGQLIHAEVAQALLDDLATHARDGDAPFPLVRLSELAVRRQVTTINDSLAILFNAPESGPFVLLHPNRYPDCDELLIRPPTAGASGAALAYSLVPGRSGRKGPGRGRGAGAPGADPATSSGEGAAADEDEEIDASNIWQAEVVDSSTWRRIITERRRERRRLDSPSKDCRDRPAYSVLRDLLLEDSDVRQAFHSVKWRGRPAGLPLLISLLQKGSMTPEVATDHEYLEAELGDLVQGDPQWHPPDGRWKFRGWLVVREGSHHDGFQYTATHAE